MHLNVKLGLCVDCQYGVPQYGSIFDTGTVKNFIKVLYIDESKKEHQELVGANESHGVDFVDKGEQNLVQDQPESEPNSALLTSVNQRSVSDGDFSAVLSSPKPISDVIPFY